MASTINILKPSVCFEVQKVIGISSSDGSCRTYQVLWAPSWISGVHLVGCEHLIEQFEQEQKETEHEIKVEEIDFNELEDDNDIVVHSKDSDHSVNQQLIVDSGKTNDSGLCRSPEDPVSSSQPQNPCNSDERGNGSITISIIRNKSQENNDQYSAKHTNCDFECFEASSAKAYNNQGASFQPELQITEANQKAEHSNSNHGPHLPQIVQYYSKECENGNMMGVHGKSQQYNNLNTKHGIARHNEFDFVHNEDRRFVRNIDETNNNSAKIFTRGYTKSKTAYNYGKFASNFDFESNQFQCNVCENHFADSLQLQVHIRTHVKRERPFKCTVCPKTFLTSTDLKRHTRVHTGERPFECQVCNKRFKRHHHLTDHLRTHAQERPSMCDNV